MAELKKTTRRSYEMNWRCAFSCAENAEPVQTPGDLADLTRLVPLEVVVMFSLYM